MELRRLEVFVAVAEEEGFSRAAARLHVVQSAVSATVRRMEAEWGVELFHRTTHHVALTDAGRALLPEARAALQAAAAVEHAVDEVRGGLRGTVRVGIMQSPGVRVAEHIAAFRAAHPGVGVEVHQGASEAQAAAVREGGLDAAFVGLPHRRLPGLAVTPISDHRMDVLCAADHALAGRAEVRLTDLAGEPFAELPPGWGVRVANDRAFAAAGAERRIAYEINDVGTVVDFVRAGLAVAILAPAMRAGARGVAAVAIRGRAPHFAVSLVAREGRGSSPAARAFVAAVAASAGRHAERSR